MPFSRTRFQRRAISLGATVRIRFWAGAIFIAAALAFGAAATWAQTAVPEPSGKADKPAPPNDQTIVDPITTSATELEQENPAPLLVTPLAQQQNPVPLNPSTVEPPLHLPYEPITSQQRLGWIIRTTLWPQHLVGGVITSAAGTGLDHPREDGPHWGGFGERFGVRLTGVATSNVMEAGIGALWGEDPRYFRVPEDSFGGRVKNVIEMTFLARRRGGNFAPAYARYIAFSGNNFLSNAWRPDSEADVEHALLRTAEGFAGHLLSNAWLEFWPSAKQRLFHRGAP